MHLRGRVSNELDERQLPIGERVVSKGVIVLRQPNRARRSVTVDTFDCIAWTARTGDALLKLAPDDPVEITGALRRRFWRGERGTASRVEVEISRVRRLRRPP